MTQEWEYYDRQPAWRRWGARLLALLALAAVIGGLYAIYEAAIAEPEAEPTAISDELGELTEASERLGAQLDRLRPSSEPRRALRAANRALDSTRAAGRAFRASGLDDTNLGDRFRNALGAQFEYVTAVIAVLEEPGDPVYDELPARATRVRRALQALPSDEGLRDTIRGTDRLRRWASAND